MASKIWSAGLRGVEATLVAVEADAGGGDFGQIKIVGLPDTAVSEARERVKSALRHSHLKVPRRKITVNLAPADLQKHGPAYDLPIAVSILALNNNFTINLSNALFIGELSLDGLVRPVSGVLVIAAAAQEAGITNLFVPTKNAAEAKLIKTLSVYPVNDLPQLLRHLQNHEAITALDFQSLAGPTSARPVTFDLSDIKGQAKAKRGLMIAAAGGHNIIFSGPPGSGKTMLAKSMPNLLPDLNELEQLELTKIYSIAKKTSLNDGVITDRPFRSPHHSASAQAIIGGGAWPQPGEISLAHRGVLFLDEFPEFSRVVLENLRQPLEDGFVNISRSAGHWQFPSKFILLAAMNPCPCGYLGDQDRICRCSPIQINHYRARLSGSIIDRIDIHIAMPRLNWKKLQIEPDQEINNNINQSPELNSEEAKQIINSARFLQNKRFKNVAYLTNAEMGVQAIKDFCVLDKAGQKLLLLAGEKMKLSARVYFRILKLARSIADLAGEKHILTSHLAEALQYRPRLE